MNKIILAALIVANVITLAGIARADNTVQVCSLDKQGNMVACVSKPLAPAPRPVAKPRLTVAR